MVSLKKTVLDKTVFSPEHETGLGLKYMGRKSGVPSANTGIKHPGRGQGIQEEILKSTVTLFSRNKENLMVQS